MYILPHIGGKIFCWVFLGVLYQEGPSDHAFCPMTGVEGLVTLMFNYVHCPAFKMLFLASLQPRRPLSRRLLGVCEKKALGIQ